MKFITKIDEENNLRKHKVIGRLTQELLLKELADIYSDSALSNMSSIWDLANADLTSFSLEQLDEISSFVIEHRKFEDDLKVAFVASDVVIFRIMQIHSKQVKDKAPSSVKVFNDYEEAVKWINH